MLIYWIWSNYGEVSWMFIRYSHPYDSIETEHQTHGKCSVRHYNAAGKKYTYWSSMQAQTTVLSVIVGTRLQSSVQLQETLLVAQTPRNPGWLQITGGLPQSQPYMYREEVRKFQIKREQPVIDRYNAAVYFVRQQ